MKRIIGIFLSLLVLLSFTSCAGGDMANEVKHITQMNNEELYDTYIKPLTSHRFLQRNMHINSFSDFYADEFIAHYDTLFNINKEEYMNSYEIVYEDASGYTFYNDAVYVPKAEVKSKVQALFNVSEEIFDESAYFFSEDKDAFLIHLDGYRDGERYGYEANINKDTITLNETENGYTLSFIYSEYSKMLTANGEEHYSINYDYDIFLVENEELGFCQIDGFSSWYNLDRLSNYSVSNEFLSPFVVMLTTEFNENEMESLYEGETFEYLINNLILIEGNYLNSYFLQNEDNIYTTTKQRYENLFNYFFENADGDKFVDTLVNSQHYDNENEYLIYENLIESYPYNTVRVNSYSISGDSLSVNYTLYGNRSGDYNFIDYSKPTQEGVAVIKLYKTNFKIVSNDIL